MSLRRFGYADSPAARLGIVVAAPDATGDLPVTLTGELDADEAERLHTALAQALSRHTVTRLCLNASALTFVDSGGVRALLQCRDLAERSGIRFTAEQVHPNVYQVLEITGLVELLAATPLPH